MNRPNQIWMLQTYNVLLSRVISLLRLLYIFKLFYCAYYYSFLLNFENSVFERKSEVVYQGVSYVFLYDSVRVISKGTIRSYSKRLCQSPSLWPMHALVETNIPYILPNISLKIKIFVTLPENIYVHPLSELSNNVFSL